MITWLLAYTTIKQEGEYIAGITHDKMPDVEEIGITKEEFDLLIKRIGFHFKSAAKDPNEALEQLKNHLKAGLLNITISLG